MEGPLPPDGGLKEREKGGETCPPTGQGGRGKVTGLLGGERGKVLQGMRDASGDPLRLPVKLEVPPSPAHLQGRWNSRIHAVAGGGVNVWGLPPPLRDLPTSPWGPAKTHFSRKKTGNPAQVESRTGSPASGRVRGAPRPPSNPSTLLTWSMVKVRILRGLDTGK